MYSRIQYCVLTWFMKGFLSVEKCFLIKSVLVGCASLFRIYLGKTKVARNSKWRI